MTSLSRVRLRWKIIAAALALIAAVLGVWAFVIEPDRLVVRETVIELPDWPAEFDGVRIAALSDLHIGSRFMTLDKLRTVVARANALQPDLIVLLGDYVTNLHDGDAKVEPELFAPVLKELKARRGVYAVLGNHEWWYNARRVAASFEEAGLPVLENDAAQIKGHQSAFWLAGLGDYWTLHHNVRKTLGAITDDAPVIALTHTPDIFPELPDRFRLLLAGHTHGGQVNLPLLGRLVVPSQYGSRYAIGHISENGRHLFVTPGIGTSILPVRFRVPPEISLITLRNGQN
jgi:hypothetical protein